MSCWVCVFQGLWSQLTLQTSLMYGYIGVLVCSRVWGASWRCRPPWCMGTLMSCCVGVLQGLGSQLTLQTSLMYEYIDVMLSWCVPGSGEPVDTADLLDVWVHWCHVVLVCSRVWWASWHCRPPWCMGALMSCCVGVLQGLGSQLTLQTSLMYEYIDVMLCWCVAGSGEPVDTADLPDVWVHCCVGVLQGLGSQLTL